MTISEMRELMDKADILIRNNLFDILGIWLNQTFNDCFLQEPDVVETYEPVLTLLRYSCKVEDEYFKFYWDDILLKTRWTIGSNISEDMAKRLTQGLKHSEE